MKTQTELCGGPDAAGDPHGAVVPPTYGNSTFAFASWADAEAAFDDPHGSFIYSRGNNPTVRAAERAIARLCGGDDCRLFASGMGAIAAVTMHCLSEGGHAVVVRGAYGPTRSLFHEFLTPKLGVRVTEVDGRDPGDFEAAVRQDTQLVYLESPTSGLFELQDLAAVAKLCRPLGVPTAIDNSWASPLFQRPLDLGIDYEIHSATKYLGGHGDLIGGVVVASKSRIRKLAFECLHLGATMSPQTATQLTRSLRTLVPRMRVHESNALAVARFLDAHPKVEMVRCPGLLGYPQSELAASQMTGCGGLMSLRLKSGRVEDARRFVDALRLFRIGVSWGGHESLVFAPAIAYRREQPPERVAAAGISERDVRLSVGLEDSGDLIEDLRAALAETL